VSHSAAANALIEKIRGLQEEVPNFAIPTSRNANQRLSSAARVSPQFVELTAAATENNPVLTRAGSPEPDAVRDLVSYAEAYTAVADELEAMAGFVRHSVRAAKHKAGRHALATYAFTRRLANEPETASLQPVATAMKRELHRRKKAQPEPTVPPVTPTA
jgi:hypothetical protein